MPPTRRRYRRLAPGSMRATWPKSRPLFARWRSWPTGTCGSSAALIGGRGRPVGSDPPAPHVAKDLGRGVVAGRSGDPAARVRARAALVEALHGRPIVAGAQDGACGGQLIQAEAA